MKYYKYTFIAFFALVVFGTPWFVSMFPAPTRFIDNIFSYIGRNYINYSAVFFKEGITVADLHNKYKSSSALSIGTNPKKIKIVLVPGHEPDYGGAEYKRLKERDMTVELATYLQSFFQNDSHYEVLMTRNSETWNPELQNYFNNHWTEIGDFIKNNKAEMVRFLNNGSMKKIGNNMIHNSAPVAVATRLFGINKWNNENNTDIAIHIHFNDNPRSNTSTAGKYSGFAIYVPEKQYSNSTTTKAISEAIFKRLSKYNAVSNLPKESEGVVEDQDLIAVGNSNTSDAPSMLIEYGYIYEPQFSDPRVKDLVLKDLAFQTYLGIQDFFDSDNSIGVAYDTLTLPYSWSENLDKSSTNKDEIFALQSALIDNGFYPPQNKSKNDCPRSGKFGGCTLSALSQFQARYNIKNEVNVVGIETKAVLNNLYPSKAQ